MDYLTNQFIALARTLREQLKAANKTLLAIQESLHKQNAASHETDEPKNGETSPDPTLLELSFPRSIETHTILDNKYSGPFEILKFAITVATFFVVFLYTLFAGYQTFEINQQLGQMETSSKQTDRMICLYRQQVEEMHKQATAARESADTIRAINIPYVGIDEVQGPFFSKNNPPTTMTVIVRMKNFGSSPAFHFSVHSAFMLNEGIKYPIPQDSLPRVLFPGQPTDAILKFAQPGVAQQVHSGISSIRLRITSTYRDWNKKEYARCQQSYYIGVEAPYFTDKGECPEP